MKNRDQYPVQVWNDHSFAWDETFKGEKVSIPANGFKEMPFYEGHEFKGQFVVLTMKADETEDPKTQKRIRIVEAAYKSALENPTESDEKSEELHPCMAKDCKRVFRTESALIKHSIKDHEDESIVDEEAEQEMPKRGPGRPPKAQATA